jgi:GABA permease
MSMRRYLVVAHKTLAGQHLLDEAQRRMEDGPCTFHLLVPCQHPHDRSWTDHDIEAQANEVLERGIKEFEALGAEATGEIGDPNPVYAADAVLRREHFDEIILSTLPPGPSRWLKVDVPHRMERAFSLPITHLVAADAPPNTM